MINTVCFDLDGTLVDSEMVILRSFDYVFSKYLPQDKRDLLGYREFMGPTLRQTYSHYVKDEETIRMMIQDFVDYYKTIELSIIKLFPTVKETLEWLRGNDFNIVLITSKFTSSANPSLTYLDIKQYFNDFITLDRQGENPKPSAFPIELCEKDLNISKENILMVGDSSVDIGSAKNASVKSVLVDWNSWFKETFLLKPDYTISRMDELKKIINKENGGF